MTYMFILKCALGLVEEVILYYDARSKKHQTDYLFVADGVQDSNNYMFRPFPATIIRFYIPSFKSMYNKLTRLNIYRSTKN